MTRIVDHIRKLYDSKIEIDFDLCKGKWDSAVIDHVNQGEFDLVVTGAYQGSHRKSRMLIDVDRIAAQTDVPVISFPSERRLTRMHSLLVPVTHLLPVRKLMYAAYIAFADKASLKLIGVINERSDNRTEHFLEASYELIHESSPVYVGLAMTRSENVAAAINEIATEESTDLVIVSPVEQTRLPGSFFSRAGRTLQKYTPSPVLTINPNQALHRKF